MRKQIKKFLKQFEDARNVNANKIKILLRKDEFKVYKKLFVKNELDNIIFIGYGPENFFSISKKDNIKFINLQLNNFDTFAVISNTFLDLIKNCKYYINVEKYIDKYFKLKELNEDIKNLNNAINNPEKTRKLLIEYFKLLRELYKDTEITLIEDEEFPF